MRWDGLSTHPFAFLNFKLTKGRSEMVINMLEAVSAMLEIDGTDDGKSAFVQVKCAKKMLDKVIEGMKLKENLLEVMHTEHIKVPRAEKKAENTPGKDYQMFTNADLTVGKIIAVATGEELYGDTKVELDGKVMPYRSILGKPFKTIKVL
jgi:hypothetical protein